MISERELHSAIAECHGQRNPNASTCMKLASYYTILDHMREPVQGYSYAAEPAEQVRYQSGSEFSRLLYGLSADQVMPVLDELMDTLKMLVPKLYNGTIERLRNI